MQVRTDAQSRSVTSEARRAQIVAATIAVIADAGLAQASFARIAQQAGLSSTRLISYHFAGKAELLDAVAADVIASIGSFVGRRVAAQSSYSGMLRAYIESTVAFTAGHRAEMQALLELLLSGAWSYEPEADAETVGHVEVILRAGQVAGEFRDFDPLTVATVIQRAVEGLPFLLQGRPDLDCAAYSRELVTLFELGTRAGP